MDTKKGLNYAVDGLEMGFPEATQVCSDPTSAQHGRTRSLTLPQTQTQAFTNAQTETEVLVLT